MSVLAPRVGHRGLRAHVSLSLDLAVPARGLSQFAAQRLEVGFRA
jgi:hypothetical protein